MNHKRLLSAFLSVALGIWLITGPFIFGYDSTSMLVSDNCCGWLLLLWGGVAGCRPSSWPGWCIVLVGVWLQLAPLVFWAPSALMYFNDTYSGMTAFILGFMINNKQDPETKNTPSRWSHRLPVAILALLGSCCARYMAVFQLGYRDSVWDPFFNEGTVKVITSALSRSFPVSDAGLGAVCYTIEFLLAWQGGLNRWRKMPWLVFSFAFLVIPVGLISIVLIILQPLLVGAWCSWCLATALLMLPMIVLATPEFVATLRFLSEFKRKGDSFWNLFWKGK